MQVLEEEIASQEKCCDVRCGYSLFGFQQDCPTSDADPTLAGDGFRVACHVVSAVESPLKQAVPQFSMKVHVFAYSIGCLCMRTETFIYRDPFIMSNQGPSLDIRLKGHR